MNATSARAFSFLVEAMIFALLLGIVVLAAKLGEATASIWPAFALSVLLSGVVYLVSKKPAPPSDPEFMDSRPTFTIRDHGFSAIIALVCAVLWLGMASDFNVASDAFSSPFKAATAGMFLVGAVKALFEIKLLRDRADTQ